MRKKGRTGEQQCFYGLQNGGMIPAIGLFSAQFKATEWERQEVDSGMLAHAIITAKDKRSFLSPPSYTTLPQSGTENARGTHFFI